MTSHRVRGVALFASAFALHVFGAAISPALAGEYTRRLDIGGWQGGAMDRNEDGKPDFCQLSHYQDDTRYLLIIRYSGGVLLGLTDPAWGLTEDAAYPITLTLGDAASSLVASANDDETLIVLFEDAEEIMPRLAEADVLTAAGEMGRFSQPLEQSKAAMEGLEDCYQVDVLGKSPKTPNPPADSSVASKPVPTPEPAPEPAPERRLIVMENISRASPEDADTCGTGLRESLAFLYDVETGLISDFSYDFSLETQGFGDDPVCLSIHKTGTLVSGDVTGNRIELTVLERIDDGTTAEVSYAGILRQDGTGVLYDTRAPYEDLPLRTEPLQ